ncbi:hypothetical protein GZL_07875 [Streptomyces sp. 769]|nr:hypothetical protein GZL_07875 [Streptomyces sp. 769]
MVVDPAPAPPSAGPSARTIGPELVCWRRRTGARVPDAGVRRPRTTRYLQVTAGGGPRDRRRV